MKSESNVNLIEDKKKEGIVDDNSFIEINNIIKKLNKKIIVILEINYDIFLPKNDNVKYNYKIHKNCNKCLTKLSYEYFGKIECKPDFKFTNKNINLEANKKLNITDKLIPLIVLNRIYVCTIFNRNSFKNKGISKHKEDKTLLCKINQFNKDFRIFDDKCMIFSKNNNELFEFNLELGNENKLIKLNILEKLQNNYKYLPKIIFYKECDDS